MVIVEHKIDLLRNVSIDDQINVSKGYQTVFNTEVSGFSESINTAFVRIAYEILAKQEDSSVIYEIIYIRSLCLKLLKIRDKFLLVAFYCSHVLELFTLMSNTKKDILVTKTSSSSIFESDRDIFNRPPKNLSEYRLELIDHPKSGNQSVRSSFSKISQGRFTPRQSVISPGTSFGNLLSPNFGLSPASSKVKLGSAVSISKLSRSPAG